MVPLPSMLLLLVLLLLTPSSHITMGAAATTPCSWQVDVMRADAVTTVSSLIRDTLPMLSVTGEITSWYSANLKDIAVSQGGFWSSPYVLGLTVVCSTLSPQAVARAFMLSGGKPKVILETSHNVLHANFSGEVFETFDALLVDRNQISGSSNYDLEDLLWVVPFPRDYHSFIYKCTIFSTVFTHLPEQSSHYVTLTGFGSASARLSALGTVVTNPVSLPVSGTFSMAMVPGSTPTVAMVTIQSATPTYIVSDNFFKTYTVHQLTSLPGTDRCPCSGSLAPPVELSIVSLPDQLLFVSQKGVSRVVSDVVWQDGTQPASFSLHSLYDACPRHLVASQQTSARQQQRLLLLGGCGDYNKVSAATYAPRNGSSLAFGELVGSDGQTLCVAAGAGDCSVVTATIAASTRVKYIALVSHTVSPSYSLWQYPESDTRWTRRSLLPDAVPIAATATPYLVEAGAVPGLNTSLVLTSISVTTHISNYVFLMGNRLLVSQDEGQHFYLMEQFAGPGNIVQFVSAENGWFAFLTDTGKVWVGLAGRFQLTLIYPSESWDVLHWESGDLTPDMPCTVVSIFFDIEQKLYLLVVPDGENHLVRVNARLEELLQHISSTAEWTQRNVPNSVTVEALPDRVSLSDGCPFVDMLYQVHNISWFTKDKVRHYGGPLLASARGLYSALSVLLYQAVIESARHTEHDYTDTPYLQHHANALQMWHSAITKDQEFQAFLFENGYISAGVFIDPMDNKVGEEVSFNASDMNQTSTFSIDLFPELPDLIYLNKGEVFTLTVYVLMDQHEELSEDDANAVRIGVTTTDTALIAIRTERTYLPLSSMVSFKVEIEERGVSFPQQVPGYGLVPAAVSVSVAGAATHCFDDKTGTTKQKGVHEMSVILGCPPTQTVVFDFYTSKSNAESLGDTIFDCYIEDPKLPCFYFANGFYPAFQIIDSATGAIKAWQGNYTLRIIGGGHEAEITRYSTADIFRYNSLNSGEPSLIISPMNDAYSNDDGWVVYNEKEAGVSWFCQSQSPCTLIFPVMPNNSHYYFLAEFSNRGVDKSSHCDYTMEFVLHVHGVPINDVSFSSGLVLLSAFIICAWCGLFYYDMKRGDELRLRLEIWWRKNCRSPKVEPEEEEQKDYTNEELEELAKKDWKKALQLKTGGSGPASVDSLKASSQDVAAVTTGVHSTQSKPTAPRRRTQGSVTSSRRRTSVSLAGMLDGHVSVVDEITQGDLMRLRLLNRVYLSKNETEETVQEEDEDEEEAQR